MKIFFTASYEGKKYYQKQYDEIIKIIKSTGAEIVSPELSREYQDAFRPENIQKLGDRDRVHYEFIRQGIANADAVIIEASNEDFRIGHEATLAIIYQKPVLCLSLNKDYGRLVRHEEFRGTQYTEENVHKLVLSFLSEVSKKLLRKRQSSLNVYTTPHRKAKTSRGTIAVLGSINIDLITKVPHFPKVDEVVISEGLKLVPGGKATNAAIGLARLSEQVSMIGKIGNDFFGEEVISLLKREDINTDFIDTDSFIPTGTVMVTVDAKGKNTLTVNEDANIRINKQTIIDFLSAPEEKKRSVACFYTTLEPITDIVTFAIEEFHKRKIPIFCDAAPQARPLPEMYYSLIDFLSANEFEASSMSGMNVKIPDSAMEAARFLRSKGARTVIITLGHLGAIILPEGNDDAKYFKGNRVHVVDETGAGDAFRAGFVSEYLRSKDVKRATKFANLTGAYAVTRLGSYNAMPTRGELEFLKTFNA